MPMIIVDPESVDVFRPFGGSKRPKHMGMIQRKVSMDMLDRLRVVGSLPD
jgi:hypothetical protein